MAKEGLKTCIRCGRTQPASNFWASRPTCVECARRLWYSPKTKADPRDSKYWPLIQSAIRRGWVKMPPDAFPK